VPADRGARVAARTAEFVDVGCCAERKMVVGGDLAGINVPITEPVGALEAGEVKCYGPVLILEVSRPVLVLRRVNSTAEIHRRFPAEVIGRVSAVRCPDVREPAAAGAVAAEVDPVPVRGESRRIIVARAA